jgi:tetratricopeptide (TPR) repeat protein
MTQQEIATLEKKVGVQARSPLFAMLAEQYLSAGKSQEALKLCDSGLANFPFFTTGHLIKGKSLVALKMLAEARREFEFVLDFLPGNSAVTALLASIPRSSNESLTAETPAPRPSATPRMNVSPAPVEQHIIETPPLLSPQPDAELDNFGMPAAPSAPPESDFGYGISAPTAESNTQFGLPESAPVQANPFDSMSQFTEIPAAAPSPALPAEDPFGFAGANSFEPPQSAPSFDIPSDSLGISQPPQAGPASLPLSQEESSSFEIYAARKKTELTGVNTLSFEDFKKSAPQAFPSAAFETPAADFSQDNISDFAEKLQNVPRITPVINFAEKDTPALSPEDSTSSMGFVTPTLAEIYAKQGWYDDAIKAYKTLAQSKPAEREKYEKRVAEIEEIKKKSAMNNKPS